MPITFEIAVDGTLKINAGKMSDEDYESLPDFYKNYLEACNASDSISNFRKFKMDLGEEYAEETDDQLEKYANVMSSRVSEIRIAIMEHFKDQFTSEMSLIHFETMLTEMITNGVHHGNCNDTRKNLLIEAKIVGEGKEAYLKFSITDEGKGFDTSRVNSTDTDVDANFGRGIVLTNYYSVNNNSLTYEDEGRKANFKIYLHSQEEEDEQE